MIKDSNLLTELEKALSTLTKKDFLEVMSSIDSVAWIEHNRTLKGKPFSLAEREYLLQPYRDDYQDLIFYKGRQVEMSEFSMNWLLNKLHKYPYTAGLHTFPRDNQCLKFSKQRLDAAINDSDLISDWYDAKNSEIKMRKFVKTIEGQKLQPYNFYILGGTWESRKDTVGDAARGLTIDFIVYDERQDHPNDVETVIGEASSHSEYKQTLTLGTPKLPGTQFDIQWESSDKHFWYVRCKHCGRHEPVTMDNILDSGNEDIGYFYGCPNCKNPIDKSNGIWLPTNPHKKPQYRGYHINQLMTVWLSANDIMKKWNSKTYPKRRFYNEVLGFAYGGDDIPITLPMMYACAENDNRLGMVEKDIYVGVDWGSTSYVLLQEQVGMGHRLVDCIPISDSDPREHPKKIARELKKYQKHIRRVVCDAGPDITRFYNLRDALIAEGVTKDVWACYYATPPAKTAVSWNEKENNVTVGRSEAIEMVIDEISDKIFIIPGQDRGLERVEMMMDHFTNIAAEKGRTSSGMDFIMYVDTGPDHFLHAKVYADVASSSSESTVHVGTHAPNFNKPRPVSMTSKSNSLITPNSRPKSNSSFPVFQMKRRR